jgi:N-glycosylase/DNA lyase
MDELLKSVESLMEGEVGDAVRDRMREFEAMRDAQVDKVFEEMCFCLLTANYSAERAISIQEHMGCGFRTLPMRRLEARLRRLGYRFPHVRAKFICEARKHIDVLADIISEKEEQAAREWLADNVKGLGMKEASHFLRNIGFKDLAIVDFHIMDILERHKLMKRPKTLTRKVYLEVEAVLRRLAGRLGVSLGELDLYLWYLETGKILK